MQKKTKSEKFVYRNKEKWKTLKQILEKINLRGYNSLSEKEISDMPRLYRKCCSDLAEARMLSLSPDVLDFLNQLVGQSHKVLYSFPPVKKNQVTVFFTQTLPSIFIKKWKYMLISAFFFFSSYALSAYLVYNNSAIANILIPEQVLEMLEDSYSEGINEEREVSLKGYMTSFYIYNNVSIAFFCFASGIFGGIITMYLLLHNGVMIGAISGYIIGKGYGDNFFNFVTAHSAAELIGLTASGAAGLMLGFTIIKATQYRRKDELYRERESILTMVSASAVLLLLAAFIEGFISPSQLPYTVKAAVLVISLVLIISYFFIFPLISKKINYV
jgi:uncharacterized membrane protein SpoIIM required for sporulation